MGVSIINMGHKIAAGSLNQRHYTVKQFTQIPNLIDCILLLMKPSGWHVNTSFFRMKRSQTHEINYCIFKSNENWVLI